jgi:hypothetical protein
LQKQPSPKATMAALYPTRAAPSYTTGWDTIQKIYRFTISGSYGTLQGTTSLGNADTVYQWVIDKKKVVGSDDIPSTVWYWNYPAGGSATKSITKGVFHPIGAAISEAKS